MQQKCQKTDWTFFEIPLSDMTEDATKQRIMIITQLGLTFRNCQTTSLFSTRLMIVVSYYLNTSFHSFVSN